MSNFANSYIRYRDFKSNLSGISYTPKQLAQIYNFPTGNGSGYKIGFIELGGGFKQTDLNTYFRGLSLLSPTVQFVSVDGAINHPTTFTSADAEVMLDLCVAIGVANGITPIVYMAPNTEQGFIHAVSRAVSDNVDAISISWGAPENMWSSPGRSSMNTVLQTAANANIFVAVASGDRGSSDGESSNNVDFPASSPFVLGVGGTSLIAANNGSVLTETVWNNNSSGATGGGVSAFFALPAYQANANVNSSNRGVPDVAAIADPAMGIRVIVDGQTLIIGGTSAGAPLWAGLATVLSQGLGRRVGNLNSRLYGIPAAVGAFRDITIGNNGSFQADTGWDACTGLGTPNGKKLLSYLSRI